MGHGLQNKPVPPQMMEPIGDLCQNVSQLPKLFFVLEVLATTKNRYHFRIGHHFLSHQE